MDLRIFHKKKEKQTKILKFGLGLTPTHPCVKTKKKGRLLLFCDIYLRKEVVFELSLNCQWTPNRWQIWKLCKTIMQKLVWWFCTTYRGTSLLLGFSSPLVWKFSQPSQVPSPAFFFRYALPAKSLHYQVDHPVPEISSDTFPFCDVGDTSTSVVKSSMLTCRLRL